MSGEGAVECHPLIREYFALRLKEMAPHVFRSAHSRLFDHLCATTPPRPDTLPGLHRLYQADVHLHRGRRKEELADAEAAAAGWK